MPGVLVFFRQYALPGQSWLASFFTAQQITCDRRSFGILLFILNSISVLENTSILS